MTLKPRIVEEGQDYWDRPIYAIPKRKRPIEVGVQVALKTWRKPREVLLGHERERLRWMKPDGKGGLQPR